MRSAILATFILLLGSLAMWGLISGLTWLFDWMFANGLNIMWVPVGAVGGILWVAIFSILESKRGR